MYEHILEDLGLSPNEAKIYEALTERGESSISNIAVAAKIHRRNAYDAIQRLIDKGLCFQIFSTTENRYNAVDPDKLLELTAERQQKLQAILPELRDKFSRRFAPEEAYIYRGLEGQKNIWREMLRVGKDVYIVGAKAQWYDPRITSQRVAFFREVNRKKIEFHLLIDHEVKMQMPDFLKTYSAKQTEGRFLPKEHSTNSVMIVFGDYLVTYTGVRVGKFDDGVVFFVIRSKNLAESYRSWFRYMWQQSSEDRK